jgi:DNA-binding response OmpR family regulator
MNDDWDSGMGPGATWSSPPSVHRSGRVIAPSTLAGSTGNCVRFLLVTNDDLLGSGMQTSLGAAGHAVRWLRRLPSRLVGADDHDAVIVDLESVAGADAEWRLALQGYEAPWPVLIVGTPVASAGEAGRAIAPEEIDHWASQALALADRAQADPPSQWLGGDLLIDTARQAVRLNGAPIELTPFEWQVIALLAGQEGRVVSRADIARMIGGESDASDNAVAVHLYNLRRKLGRHAIETIRGRGFRLRA